MRGKCARWEEIPCKNRKKSPHWEGDASQWGAGVLGSGRTDHQTLNLAILTEILDGGHRPDVISVVDGVVIGLGVTDDQGIGDFKPPEQEAVPEKHVNPLGAVSVELRLAGVLGAVVHKIAVGEKSLLRATESWLSIACTYCLIKVMKTLLNRLSQS